MFVRVWDLPTRIFHGAIIGLIAYLWWTERTDDITNHKLAGFALIALVAFRIFWGIVGSQTARFSDFVKGPRAAWRYMTGRGSTSLGHNPIGGWSVVALLCLIAVECLLGLFAIDEDGLESGPLAPTIGLDWAQQAAHWHAMLFNVLLAVIGVHIGAVLVYSLFGKSLVLPMITGRRGTTKPSTLPTFAPWWLALCGVVLAAAAFYGLWRLDNS